MNAISDCCLMTTQVHPPVATPTHCRQRLEYNELVGYVSHEAANTCSTLVTVDSHAPNAN